MRVIGFLTVLVFIRLNGVTPGAAIWFGTFFWFCCLPHPLPLVQEREKPELAFRLFVRFDPYCVLSVTLWTVSGGDRVPGRARAIDPDTRTNNTHNEPAAGM